jgi:hypothetical protein
VWADAGAPAAVLAAHQVADLALDLGAGGGVVGLSGGVGLAGAGTSELLLVGSGVDRAPALSRGAPVSEWAARACLGEPRDPPIPAAERAEGAWCARLGS